MKIILRVLIAKKFEEKEKRKIAKLLCLKNDKNFVFHIWFITKFEYNFPRDDSQFFLHLALDD